MNKRLPLLLSLLGVILLAASLAYWILQLYQPPQRPIAAVPRASLPEPQIDAAATLFGGQVVTASAASYQLTGIVAAGRESVAIIVAEGSPPKALRVGKELVPGITLAEVHPRYVMLSDGGVMKRLDLATDARPAAAMGGAAGQANSAAASMPANLPPGAPVPEPPMSPGAVPQQPPPNQEYASPGDVGQHDAPPPPATPNIAVPNNPNNPNANNPNNPNANNPNANNPNANNPAPAPVQMPPPTRATGSPVSSQSQTQ
jgi:general secretion pathway protein C